MGFIACFIGLALEITLTAVYCIVLGTLTMLAIVIVAPLAIIAETLFFLADLFRPAPTAPPPS